MPQDTSRRSNALTIDRDAVMREIAKRLGESTLPGSARVQVNTPGGSVTVPRSSPYQPDTLTNTGTIDKQLRLLELLAPAIRGRISSAYVAEQGRGNVLGSADTNGFGVLSAAPRRVSISPQVFDGYNVAGVLGHEAYHSTSRENNHDDAYRVQTLIDLLGL